MAEKAMYWSSDPLLRVSAIADVASKGPFQKLSHDFHLNNNSAAVAKVQPEYDPLFKVHPLLDSVTVNSRAHYFPGRDISGDDQVQWSVQLQAVHQRCVFMGKVRILWRK